MNLKYEFKDYIPRGSIYFVSIFICANISLHDWGTSLIVAFLASMAYVITIFLLGEKRAKKAQEVAGHLMESKNIICQGLAIYGGKGAWMYLSEETLDIYFDQIDIMGRKMTIMLKDITKIELSGKNKITLYCDKNQIYQIAVVCALDWMKILREKLVGSDKKQI